MKANKELIHTVRTILQQFPEGVIIRSIDPITKQTISKFANDMADKVIYKDDDAAQDNIVVKIIHADQLNQHHHVERIGSLNEFLYHQELKVMEKADFK